MEHLEDRTTPTALFTDTNSYAADRVIVSLAADATPAAAGLTTSPLASGVESIGLGMVQVNLRQGVTVGQAISTFSGANGVLFVEPDYTLGVQLTPNDPGYANGSLWGLNNTGQNGGVVDADIDAPEAWDIARGTGAKVVAVIDTGVDYTHPDLNANMWRNPGETAGDGIDNDGNGWVDDVYGADFANNDGNPMDDHGHGTHVAGTIGAVGDNSIGVTGVAWTTRIMALKFLTSSGSGSTSNAVRAIDYAVAKGAKILNNSWGGGGYSLSLEQAIQRAANAGVIFVAAAGNAAANNDTTANYPSNYPTNNVVAVAATTLTDSLASYSSYGASTVDLGAPGSSIYSTTRGGGYGYMSGTSMATPHVAGALAVYWDANPTLSYTQVIQRLMQTVDPLASLSGRTVSGGRLNLRSMLEGTSPPVSPPPVSPPPVSPPPVSPPPVSPPPISPPPPLSPPTDVTGARVTFGAFAGQAANSFDRVRVTFSEAIYANSFTTADIVSLTGPTGSIVPSAVTLVAGTDNQFDVTFATQTVGGNYSVVLGPDVLDLAGNAMDQNQNGTNGEATDRYALTNVLYPSRSVFSATGLPVNIRDYQTTTVGIVVPASSGLGAFTITDLNVSLTAKHGSVGDLRITLTSPTGVAVTLFERRGGSGNNLAGTTFDDEATVSIGNGSAPFYGSFRPEAALSAFDGLNPVGTWTLRVTDLSRRFEGSLSSASIDIAVGPGGNMVRLFGTPDEVTESFAGDSMKSGIAIGDFVARAVEIVPPTDNGLTHRDGSGQILDVTPSGDEIVPLELAETPPAFDHLAGIAVADWFTKDRDLKFVDWS